MATSHVQEETKSTSSFELPSLVELLEAGVHFGHERSKQNPKMKPYIYTQRNRIAILDLEKTSQALGQAVKFLHTLVSQSSKEVLFVGTKRQARQVVKEQAEAAGMPYVTKRWLGGTLTNFATILKSIEKLEELKASVKQTNTVKLTKKELSVRNKEIGRLESVLEGIRAMRSLPGAIIVVGTQDEKIAVQEAKKVGIPIIGIVDTNTDPTIIDYPIPANDDAVRSITLILSTLAKTIAGAKSHKA